MSKREVTVDARQSCTSGAVVYRIRKPGFQHDLFLTEDEVQQLLKELDRVGVR